MNQNHFLSDNITASAEQAFHALPVYTHLKNIVCSLHDSSSHCLVLTAETAAGKSTAVPFALLDAFPGKVLMLEPRRLAVLAVAERTAQIVDDKPGGLIGYRMHLETKVSSRTRFEVLTEAILLRMMESEPDLPGVSVVIIDEFHERSIYADTALAFLKDILLLRDDIFVLIMSATIDTEKICTYLQCATYQVPGRQFPVSIEYMPVPTEKAVCTALDRWDSGSILVFLPGIGDIRRTRTALEEMHNLDNSVEVLILHSSVPFEMQRKVLSPPPPDVRRVILASSVAETSLTVQGVTVVIDSGLARISRFESSCGMNRLVTENESVFSAVQRAGRAGRTSSGHCIRLWAEHDIRVSALPPEIMRTDLVPIVLECVCWGIRSMQQLSWLDPPPASTWDAAVDFLTTAGCLENGTKGVMGQVTSRGRRIQSLGVHPRIGAVAVNGSTINLENAVAYAVTYNGTSSPQETERLRKDLLRKLRDDPIPECSEHHLSGASVLVYGFFDRLALHTGGGIYQFPSGRKACLPIEDARLFSDASFPLWIVAPEADAGERTGRIYRWEAIGSAENIQSWLNAHTTEKIDVFFADVKICSAKVRKMKRRYYGKILLSESAMEVQSEDIKVAYCFRIREEGFEVLPWNKESLSLLMRYRFFLEHSEGESSGDWAALEKSMLNSLEDWLVPFLPQDGKLSPQLFYEALRYKLNGAHIDKIVPLRITLQNRREVSIIYEETGKNTSPIPVLEIIIQQIFGCFTTPTLCGVPVLLKLLSPARRPLQVTTDIAGFWQNTWPEICKEMKGRYPKHNWNYKDTDSTGNK